MHNLLRNSKHSGLSGYASTLLLYTVFSTAQAQGNHVPETEFDCFLAPGSVIELGSAAPGLISSISVERNDYIIESQTIAELESHVEEAAVSRAIARTRVTANIEVRDIYARFAEQQRQRTLNLLGRDMVSQQEYRRLETDSQIANLQLSEAKDNQTIAYLELLQAEAALDKRKVKSPISGIVVERYKSAGEFVDDQAIFKIANIDTLSVELLIPVEFIGRISAGMIAQISAIPEHFGSHEAVVTMVDKIADAPSSTFRVRLELANVGHQLPAGLRCLASFESLGSIPNISAAQPSLVTSDSVRDSAR